MDAGYRMQAGAYAGHGDNTAIFEQSAFALFCVAHLDGIEPMYGDWSLDFCRLEAGYIGQLLTTHAPQFGVGLCAIGAMDFADAHGALRLGERDLLIQSFLGGRIDGVQVGRIPESLMPADTTTLIDCIKRHVAAQLPAYMEPQHYVVLKALPLTRNGKLDRAALPAMTGERIDHPEHGPASATERAVAAIYEDLLKTGSVAMQDSFFELGGDSLLATRLTRRVRETFGVDVPLARLFRHSSVSAVAEQIDTLISEQEVQTGAGARTGFAEQGEI
jgi:acyl carrier protein